MGYSDLQGHTTNLLNRDDFSNLGYTVKLLSLGRGILYPVAIETDNRIKRFQRKIGDLNPTTLTNALTEVNHVKGSFVVAGTYTQAIKEIKYNESTMQNSKIAELSYEVLKRLNIDYERTIYYGDNFNTGLVNNENTVNTDLGSLTSAQELYEAIVSAWISMSSFIESDSSERAIMISETTQRILMTPAGSGLDTADYISRLRNSILGGNTANLVIIPDFIFKSTGASLFAIVERSLLNYHVMSAPVLRNSGNNLEGGYNYFNFDTFSVFPEVRQLGAVNIFSYTYAPALVSKSDIIIANKSIIVNKDALKKQALALALLEKKALEKKALENN